MLRKKVVFSLALGLFSALSIFIILPQGTALAAGETCFSHIDDTREFTGTTAVQEAINVADENDLIKVAGNCTGGTMINGSTQTAYITESITIQGGYTNTNWNISEFATYPTTLTQIAGPVMVITGAGITPTIDSLIIREGQGGINVIDAEPILQNLVIEDNTDSGLTLNNADDTQVLTTTIQNNNALGDGGGVYIAESSDLLLQEVNILINTAGKNGGGLYVADTNSVNLTIRQTTINGNIATINNGALLIKGDGAILEDVTIENNLSQKSFTIRIESNNARLTRVKVLTNTATLHAGGLRFEGENAVLEYLTITGNTSNFQTDGGGIYLNDFNNGILRYSIIMDNKILLSSSAIEQGGGIFVASGNSYTIENNIIAHNKIGPNLQDRGAGLYLFGNKVKIHHNTIVSNSGGEGDALGVDGTEFDIKNNIFSNHTYSVYAWSGNNNAHVVDGNIVSNVSTPFYWVTPGSNNRIDCDPSFVNANGRDYHLDSSSCAIDHGSDVGVSTDIEGSSRPQGLKYDAGAYETGYTATVSVSLSDVPNAQVGQPVTFVATIYPTDAEVTYTWSADGFSTQNGNSAIYQWSTIGTKVVQVTVDDTPNPPVSAVTTIAIANTPKPIDFVTISGKEGGFAGRTYIYTATINTDAVGPVNYTWEPAPLSGQGDPVVTYRWTDPGLKDLTVTADNGFSRKTNNYPIEKIHEYPNAGFNADPPSFGGPAPLVITLTNPANHIDTHVEPEFIWEGDGITRVSYNTNTSIVLNYIPVGTHVVTHTVIKRLDNSDETASHRTTKVITVYEPALADMTATPLSATTTTTASFKLCDASSGEYDQLAWTFGDGKSEKTTTKHGCVDHIYTLPSSSKYQKTYTAKLEITGLGGTSVVSQVITIYRTLEAAFDMPVASPYVTTKQVCFTNQSNGHISSHWNLGGVETTTQASTFCHNFTEKRTYDIVLTVTGTNGNTKQKTESFTLYEPVQAKFDCIPENPRLNLEFITCTDQSTGDVAEWKWDFGDGTIIDKSSPEPVKHLYKSAGEYTIKLTITGDGQDQDSYENKGIVLPGPLEVDLVADEPTGSARKVTFTGIITEEYEKLEWDFDYDKCINLTEFAISNPTLTKTCFYNDTDSSPYTAVLTATGYGWVVTDSVEISVNEGVFARFEADPTTAIREPDSSVVVTFTNKSEGDYEKILVDYGDGITKTISGKPASFSHEYHQAGTYPVTFTISGPGGTMTTHPHDPDNPMIITIYDKCQPSFDYEIQSASSDQVAPVTLVVTNTTQGACEEATWNFGDGRISNQFNPGSHIYDISGIYPVKLTMSGDAGTETYVLDPPLEVFGSRCKFEDDKTVTLSPPQSNGDQDLTLTYPVMKKELKKPRSDVECYVDVQWYENRLKLGKGVGTIITATRQVTVGSHRLAPPTVWQARIMACHIEKGCNHESVLWSNEAIIQRRPNIPPEVLTATIVPSLPLTIEPLKVEYDTTDKDGDSVDTVTNWYKVTLEQYYQALINPADKDYGRPDIKDQENVPANETKLGDIWCAEILPHDGKDFGEIGEQCVRVGSDVNRPPTVMPHLSIIRDTDKLSGTLEAKFILEYEYYDDVGAVGEHTIRWYRKGDGFLPEYTRKCSPVSVDEGNNLNKGLYRCELSAETVDPGETWFAIIEPYDTQINGLPIKSNEVLVHAIKDNTPPEADEVKIIPFLVAKDDENLHIDYLYWDAEDDAESGSYIYWYETSTDPSNRVTLFDGARTIPHRFTLPNQIWYAVVIPGDGRALGDPDSAHTVLITNVVPLPSLNVSISPVNPSLTETIYLKGLPAVDENVTLSIMWTLNDGYQATLDGDDSIDAEHLEDGQVWCATVTVQKTNDENESNSVGPLCANVVAIKTNTLPELKGPPYIFPPTLNVGEQLFEVKYDYFDADGDLEGQTEIRWYNRGVVQPDYNDAKRIRVELQVGEVWHATVRPHDGKEYGAISTTVKVTVIAASTPPKVEPTPALSSPVIAGTEVTFIEQPQCVSDSSSNLCEMYIRWYFVPTNTSTSRLSSMQTTSTAPAEIQCKSTNNLSDDYLLVDYNNEKIVPAGVITQAGELTVCVWADDGKESDLMATTATVIKVGTSNTKTYLPAINQNYAKPISSMRIEPPKHDFGKQSVGEATAPQNFTVASTGKIDLNITKVQSSSDSFIPTHNCNEPIPQNESCQVTVTFTPPTKGAHAATITIESNTPSGAQTVAVSGEGWAEPCTEIEGYEPNNGMGQACPIQLGKPIRAYPYDGNVPNKEYDIYKFELNSTSSVKVHLKNYKAVGHLYVYDKKGVWIGKHQLGGDEKEIPNASNRHALEGLDPGWYYIMVHTKTFNGDEPAYELEVRLRESFEQQ
ncbi:PKD domain-containing protein [Anaerolineales bacterium HSG25]|nr:PKD domain-containing protein [Anaerolineales bacterium HSG25]